MLLTSPGMDLGAGSTEGSAEEQLYYRQEPAHSHQTATSLSCDVTAAWRHFSYHQQSLLREQVGSCHMLPSDSSDTSKRTVTEMYTHQSTLDRDAPIGPRGARTPQAGVRRLTAPVLFCVELCPLFSLSVNEPTTAV